MSDPSAFPDYFNFDHPLVRDLCWTLSPRLDLLQELPPYQRFIPPQPPQELRQWLAHLQNRPEPLETFFSSESRRRLGHHFERLILFYLTHAPGQLLQVLDHNRPIYTRNSAGHRVTVGELDFLLSGIEGTVHLETAVKFFLGVEHAGAVCWLGPSLEDRLDRKIQHLREHQLPLSQFLETEITTPVQRRFWVKGILFHPWQQKLTTDPTLLHQPDTNMWLTCADALDLPLDQEWVWLPKSRWLGCGVDDPEEQRATKTRIQAHFKQSNRVLMMSHPGSAARRLIVADDWPAAAQAALATRRE